MPKSSVMVQYEIRMMEKLGFDEKLSTLIGMDIMKLDTEYIKEEMICENKLLLDEIKDFVPLYKTLDDFKDEDIYKNSNNMNSTILKNPIYRTISKPKMGKMIIDKQTGERKIIHND